MAADSTIDLVINQKSSFEVTFFVKESGVAANLTGYSTSAKLKTDFQVPDSQAISFTSSANTTTGAVTISLTPEQTSALAAQRYFYDVTITSSAGFKTRIVEGRAMVSGGVS